MKTGSVFAIALVITGVIVFFFVNGTEFNQDSLDESLQNIPQSIQDVSKTAKDFATEATIVLRESINDQLEKVQIGPEDTTIEDISEIPKKIQENIPLNQKPVIDKAELERQVHQLTNQYRTQNGISSLSWDDKLANVARTHSQDMASRNYFSHETPEGTNPTSRGTTQGYKCEKIIGNIMYIGIAENIFQNNLAYRVWYTDDIPTSFEWNSQDEIVQTTVDGWMDSPGHRKNILTKTFEREGIGVEISSDDKVYITQNFC